MHRESLSDLCPLFVRLLLLLPLIGVIVSTEQQTIPIDLLHKSLCICVDKSHGRAFLLPGRLDMRTKDSTAADVGQNKTVITQPMARDSGLSQFSTVLTVRGDSWKTQKRISCAPARTLISVD